MKTLKERQKLILKQLYYSVAPIGVDSLCETFDVSLRTIRYDLNELRDYLEDYDIELNVKNRAGYSIMNRDKIKLSSLLGSELMVQEVSELSARKEMLFFEFLTRNRPITMSQIVEKLYLSESSVSKLIQSMNLDLEAFHLYVKTTKNGYELQGNEFCIRRLATDYIQDDVVKHFNHLNYYDVFPEALKFQINRDYYQYIASELDKINQLYHVWLSQQTHLRLLIYLIISHVRISNGSVQRDALEFDSGIFGSEKEYATQLYAKLFDSQCIKHEIEAFISFLLQEGIFVHRDGSDISSASNALVSEIIVYLKSQDISMNYEGLFDDLSKHISVSLKRSYAQFEKEKNPILNQIKQQHQKHYQMAQSIHDNVVAKSIFGYGMSDDELSFLAIYLYKNELRNVSVEHFKVYVACASSRGVSKLLETRIKHVFPHITVLGTLTVSQVINDARYLDADFIISTIPIKNVSIPVIHVTQLLNVNDINQIQKFLSYGITSRVIPNTSKDSLDEYLARQFEHFGENTLISIETLSKVILSVLDIMVSIDSKYEVSDQKVLGVLIHCILAIPRWIENSEMYDDYVDEVLETIKRKHGIVYSQFEAAFDLIEQELGVILNGQERLSFFDYIVERNRENETGDF